MSPFNEWVVVDPGSGPSPPQPAPPGIPDAPSDGSFYGRENAAWINLPVASTSVLGGVKVDGTTVVVAGGVISAVGVTASSPVNTTAPIAAGAGTVGSTLTCSSGAWTNSPTSYLYQWARDGSSISGATGSSYVVATADSGHAISCTVTATNSAGAGVAGSNAISVASAPAPVNTVAPAVTGTATVGSTLTCSQGTWSNTPTSYAYQWLQNGSNISGATASTYVIASGDAGHSLICTVTASNSFGTGSATSNATTVQALPVNTAAPVVTVVGGLSPSVGHTLSCTQGVWSNAPTSYAYQWLRAGANIPGATSSTYLLVSADSGNSVYCAVAATNATGSGAANSNALTVGAAPPTNISPPVVTGLPTPGNTLSCTRGSWTGTPTSYAYQWKRDGATNIGIASTYVLVSGDVSHSVTCTVTATNAGGPGSPVTSNAINAVPPMTLPAGAVGVYSLRNIVSGYAGKCVNIKRWSDGVSIDVGFTSSGDIDIATALSWAAGAIMTVNTWYDQSGNNMNLTQTNASQSPELLTIGGQPWLAFGGQFLTVGSVGALALTGNQTIGVVLQLNSDIGQIALECDDDTNGWAIFMNGLQTGAYPSLGTTPGKSNYYTGGGGLISGSFNLFTSMPTRAVFTRSAGAVTIYNNGTSVGAGSGSNTASSNGFTIGCDVHVQNSWFEGLIGEVFLYASALTTGQLSSIDTAQAGYWGNTGFTTPVNGTASVQFGRGEAIAMGNVLNFERTQPYTIFGAFQFYAAPSVQDSAMCIFTNVPGVGPAYPGYELWIDTNGHLRVRIMHDINANNYVGVIGSVNVADGFKHVVASTYDGSSTAAGVKLYVDGVLDTSPTVEHDALTASIIAAGQSLFVGTQQAEPGFNLRGMLGRFQVDNVARSSSYIATYNTPSNLPPVDANTVLCLELTEGSGTIAHDSSASALNGTLSHATMWVL